MNKSIFRYSIVVLLAFFMLLGCVDSDNDGFLDHPYGDIDTFVWETSGGGDILFSVVPAGDTFQITISRYSGQLVDIDLRLTEENAEVYALVNDIFNRDINLYDYTFTPQGMTGTWTTITLFLYGDQELEIENIDNSSELGDLYDWVKSNIISTL